VARPARLLMRWTGRGVFRVVAVGVVVAAVGVTAGSAAAVGRPAVSRPHPASPVSPSDDPAKCLPFPTNLQLNPRFPLPKPLPGSIIAHGPLPGCSYAAGFTNARKLREAVLVGPGLADLHLGLVTYARFPPKYKYTYIYQQVAAQLEYHGQPDLPPARGTLLAFGFMPVSATLQLSEIGSMNAGFISCTPDKPQAKCPVQPEALLFGQVTLRIYNVAVNGVPLNVGPHCQTVTPFGLKLTGRPPSYNDMTLHGILTGKVTVPQFTGCANGPDNFDSIFDATVSGPGNFVKLNQAPFCSPTVTGAPGCGPKIPRPKHGPDGRSGPGPR
jgi:hypothetical protein